MQILSYATIQYTEIVTYQKDECWRSRKVKACTHLVFKHWIS